MYSDASKFSHSPQFSSIVSTVPRTRSPIETLTRVGRWRGRSRGGERQWRRLDAGRLTGPRCRLTISGSRPRRIQRTRRRSDAGAVRDADGRGAVVTVRIRYRSTSRNAATDVGESTRAGSRFSRLAARRPTTERYQRSFSAGVQVRVGSVTGVYTCRCLRKIRQESVT